MKFFLKKTIGWTVYLVLTVAFFSLPIILRNDNSADLVPNYDQLFTQGRMLLFEFAGGTREQKVEGDSTAIRMVAVTDTSEKTVCLFVNGERQDTAVVSDSMEIEFPRVYLEEGENEITAVLRSGKGDTLALRRMRIVSLKKL